MKNLILIFFAAFLLSNCTSQNQTANRENKEIAPQKNEDGEWDLDVIDTDFNYFMNAVAKPMNMYSEASLKSRNTMLVSEWNGLYYSGRYPNIVESSIDYDPRENYGIKFEYKLYQVFVYTYWKYKLRLNGVSGADLIRR